MNIPADFGLLRGERIVWYGRLSWRANWFLILLGLLTIWILGLGLIFFLIAFLRVKSSEYIITNKRVYSKYGLIGRRVFEIRNEEITGYIVNQGIIGRILNYGDVIISTPGQVAGTSFFVGVHDPMRIRSILEEVISGRNNYFFQ